MAGHYPLRPGEPQRENVKRMLRISRVNRREWLCRNPLIIRVHLPVTRVRYFYGPFWEYLMARNTLDDPKLYLNRHLQWIAFNHRVLQEAQDRSNPLLERVKFLAITANNLDEFVEIRVSSF